MYGATGGPSHQQVMDGLGPTICVKRKLNPVDLFGIDGKNTYEIYDGPSNKDGKGQNLPLVARIGEKSGFCERQLCCGGREAKWESRLQNKTGPLVWEVDKKRHWPCFPCCSRPGATIKDSQGQVLGSVEDPWLCPASFCYWHNDIYDKQGKQLYHVEGSACCQLGLCCPCLADVVFDVQAGAKGGPHVGSVRRLKFDSMMECFCPTMRYAISFPKAAGADERVLLTSSTLMVDTVYLAMDEQEGA